MELSRRQLIKVACLGIAGCVVSRIDIQSFGDEATLLIGWKKERNKLFDKLTEWAGRIPQRGELLPQQVWRREYSTHTELKVTYVGEPGKRIPAYLLIPRKPVKEPIPAVFAAHQCGYLCDIGKEQVVGKCVDLPDQSYGLELVKRGFAVLAPDANKVGERFDSGLRKQWYRVKDISEQHACCGATPGGSLGYPRWKPIYDVMRGLDYLSSRDDIDHDRIGMIGFSLGSDTTIWAMPFDNRIKAAAVCPGGIIKKPRTLGWSPYGLPYADILKLIAPRPFFEATGRADYINYLDDLSMKNKPDDVKMARKREAHKKAREVYELFGCSNALGIAEFDVGHEFQIEMRTRCYEWLERFLLQ